MKSKLCTKLKIFVIATLVILVAGMALIGTLGFNQNYGYKPSYEVQVSVDQNAGDSVDVLKKATAKAFASNGVTPVSYTIQEGNDGTIIYYQFSSDVTSKKASIQSTIQAQLDLDASVSNLVATVKVYEYHGSTDKQVVNTLIAIAVAVVIAFVYAIFLTKIKGAVATLATMVLSALLGIAIIGLTRIPVAPYLAMFIGVATLVGGVTAIALMSKIKAIEKAGYTTDQIKIALDAASSEWYHGGGYNLPKRGKSISGDGLIDYYEELISKYPIISLEDGLSEDDWDGWKKLTDRLGRKLQLVGDDLFVTNTNRLKQGFERGAGNSILIKPNQIGTLTDTLDVIASAKERGYKIILSHRSGETPDTTICDIAVGVGAQFIKSGAPCRGERIAKYNRLLEIEEEIYSI